MGVLKKDISQAALSSRREQDIQREVLQFLRAAPGVVAWKAGAGAFRQDGRFVRMGRKGVSDIVGWRRTFTEGPQKVFGDRLVADKGAPVAQFLAVEVKRPGARLTSEQRDFLELVRQDGGLAIVATCAVDVARALGMSR